MPDKPGHQVEQRPLGGEQPAHRRGDAQHRLAGAGRGAVGPQDRGAAGRQARRVQHGHRHRPARQHARLPGHHLGGGRQPRRNGGHRGHVIPVPEVLLQGGGHDALDVGGVQARGG